MAGAATRPKAKSRPSGAKALERYKAKRDFEKTSEPDSRPVQQKSASGNRFVVQKHDARRLHFDLRLELGGVLKSWAVTKGPSMTAGVRRLAVETEDHPLGYINWEGVIPKGQYGGGTMIVWDQGTWSAEGDAAKALKDGKISITLMGQRLKGHWALVRMQPEGKKHNWLLIKGRDEFALKPGEEEPALTEMTSLQTGLANHQLITETDIRPDHKARAAKANSDVASTAILKKIPGAKGGILPVFVEPGLAMSVTQPPHGKSWLHEIKHDGYRIQARLEGGKVKLLTRKGLDWTAKFPPVAARLADMPVGSALIDGEIIVQDASGQSSFSGLQDDLKAKRHERLAYYAFDFLHCNGVDLRGAKLVDRKEILNQLIEATPKSFALRFSDHLDDQDGTDLLGQACKLGLEGIVSKRIDLPYISGRGEHWQNALPGSSIRNRILGNTTILAGQLKPNHDQDTTPGVMTFVNAQINSGYGGGVGLPKDSNGQLRFFIPSRFNLDTSGGGNIFNDSAASGNHVVPKRSPQDNHVDGDIFKNNAGQNQENGFRVMTDPSLVTTANYTNIGDANYAFYFGEQKTVEPPYQPTINWFDMEQGFSVTWSDKGQGNSQNGGNSAVNSGTLSNPDYFGTSANEVNCQQAGGTLDANGVCHTSTMDYKFWQSGFGSSSGFGGQAGGNTGGEFSPAGGSADLSPGNTTTTQALLAPVIITPPAYQMAVTSLAATSTSVTETFTPSAGFGGNFWGGGLTDLGLHPLASIGVPVVVVYEPASNVEINQLRKIFPNVLAFASTFGNDQGRM